MKFFLFALGWAIAMVVHAQTSFSPRNLQAKHLMTSDEYQIAVNDLRGQGWRLTYVSGYTINDSPRFAAVWEQIPSPDWVARHNLTAAQYQTEFDTLVAEGFRLVLVNGYEVNGQDMYVAIWDKSPAPPGGWTARNGMTAAVYQDTINDLSINQGYRLTHVSGYTIGGEPRFAAIWELRNDGVLWAARHGLTGADFQTEFNNLASQGYRLVLVSGYAVNNVDFYAAIWENSNDGVTFTRFGMSSAEYNGEFANTYYQGYRLEVISAYTVGGIDRYAAIWQNTVFSPDDLNLIDAKIANYITDKQISNNVGISLAITKDERLVFAKGYGVADQGTNFQVNPSHLFRIASISKTITSLTIQKLVDVGLEKTAKVFGPQGILSSISTRPLSDNVRNITVQHLLEHTSGWSDATEPLVGNLLTGTVSQTDTIAAVLNTLEPVDPPNTTYRYSNFGYIVLGRVIEAFTQTPYDTFAKINIMGPRGITRMQIGHKFSIDGEVKYYGVGDTEVNVDGFDSAGGWIAAPIDLLRMMVRVDQLPSKPDNLFSAAREREMYTVTPKSRQGLRPYGQGWLMDPFYRGHNGDLDGTNSFLAQSRNDSDDPTQVPGPYSFAVVANMRVLTDQGGFFFDMRDTIGELTTQVSKWPDYDLF
jgi:CubicO group peptidase (beta-lactamase class C family)